MRSFDKTGVTAAVRAAGGEIYGITSEPQSLAAEAEGAWDMSIPVIGDPHHEVREDLKSRGWLELFFNADYGHLRKRGWASHPIGYYQPGVIAIHRSGRVLYRWRCVPKYSNMSGAGARPEARYTWDHIQRGLAKRAADAAAYVDAELDRKPVMGSKDLSWFQFLLIMLAHGWFVRPTAFPLLRDGGKDSLSPPAAMRRWYYFAGAWLLALVLLPFHWVAIAFVCWIIAVVPGLIEIHRQFQNEPAAF